MRPGDLVAATHHVMLRMRPYRGGDPTEDVSVDTDLLVRRTEVLLVLEVEDRQGSSDVHVMSQQGPGWVWREYLIDAGSVAR